MTEELLPCPFCGALAETEHTGDTHENEVSVSCSNAECCASVICCNHEQWNRRQLAGGWISVKERLPELGHHYFYYSLGHGSGTGFYYGDKWTDCFGWTCLPNEISHWMPLPADPQERS